MNALLLLLALAAPCADLAPDTLAARVVSWDVGRRFEDAGAWTAEVSSEVSRASRDGIDVLVFPELFAWGLAPHAPPGADATDYIGRRWRDEVMPAVARAADPRMLVVLGTYPHRERAAAHAFNRAMILHAGRWTAADKLDPTQPESRETPPIRPGARLPLLSFRGGTAAVVICFSLEKPEVAVALKRAGVQLVLAPSATEDEDGVARVLRSAASRAVELGAAVLVAPLLGEQDGWRNRGSAALYLPAQKGIDHAPRESPRRESGIHRDDFTIPWARLLALRAQGERPETRPFLAPTPAFRVERR